MADSQKFLWFRIDRFQTEKDITTNIGIVLKYKIAVLFYTA